MLSEVGKNKFEPDSQIFVSSIYEFYLSLKDFNLLNELTLKGFNIQVFNFVRQRYMASYTIDINIIESIFRLKELIRKKLNIPIKTQLLTYNYKELSDDKLSLLDYNLFNESEIIINIRL